MKRTTVFLPEGAERDLKSLAARQGEPVASLIREAIADYLVRRKKDGPALSFLASGRSGQTDVATRHEELLWKGLSPHDPAGSVTKARQGTARKRSKKSSARSRR